MKQNYDLNKDKQNSIELNVLDYTDHHPVFTVEQWVNQDSLPATLTQCPINYSTNEINRVSIKNPKYDDTNLIFIPLENKQTNCLNYINGDLFNQQFKTLPALNETNI